MCAKGNKGSGVGGVGGGGGNYDTFGSKTSDLSNVKNQRQLQNYLNDNGYNIKLGRGTRAINIEVLKQSIQGMSEVIDANPFMKDMPIEVKTTTARSYVAQASISYDSRDASNPIKYTLSLGAIMKNGTTQSLERVMNGTEGFHPANQTTASAIAHEAGHFYEYYRAQKMYGSTYRAFQAVSREEISTDILDRAATKLGATTPKAQRDIIDGVSRYARTNSSEGLAECVADVYANGRNANPMSQEVWRIMNSEG